jgi:hypothetical protein
MRHKGKSINVKIATVKVIKALENKLEEIKKSYAEQGANEARYEKAKAKWQKDIGKWAIANFAKAENIRTSYRSWNKTLNVDFDVVANETDFPKEPERDFEVIHSHVYNDMVEELENAIRILKMTDEEVVSTSTYNAIARYL